MRILPRFGAALLFLITATTVQAVSFVDRVEPGKQPGDKVEMDGLSFEIKATRPTPGEVAFHVVITEEGEKAFTVDNPNVFLSEYKVKRDTDGSEISSSIVGTAAPPDFVFKINGNVLTSDFTVPENALDDPDFGLEFQAFPPPVTMSNGTKMSMPTVYMYYAHLKDFVAPATSTAVDPAKAPPASTAAAAPANTSSTAPASTSPAASTGTATPAKPAVTARVQKSDYGKTADGTVVELYTLTNHNGVVAKIIAYGATIVDLEMPDRDGKFANVVLATDTPANFLRFNQPASVMGRVANRIAGAAFTLDGHDYKLTANDGPNTLHSGNAGFNKVVWKAEIPAANKDAAPAVKLTYVSKDGDQGFPGNLTTSLTYTLTDQNVFRLEYSATTDKSTPINFTNHAYFNLAGGTGDSNKYEVMINADRYTVADATLLPTGEIAPVKDTPLDFTKPTALGARAAQLGASPHYDHSFVLNRDKDAGTALAFAARVSDPVSGRVIEAWTTEPGLQLYTSTLSAAAATGTATAPVGRPGRGVPRAGFFTLETQHFPDSIHHANFPNTILHPGETFTSTTEYRFSAK